MEVVKPHYRGKEPCRRIRLTRSPTFDGDITVCIEAKSWNSIIFDGQVRMLAGEAVKEIDVGAHVTSLVAKVYDVQTGELIDAETQILSQTINIGLSGQVATDVLPPPFRAAPPAPDLTERKRISTSSFKVDGRGRSGGFDVMNTNSAVFEAIAGSKGWTPEVRFFDRGANDQLEVIRWIKSKLEDTKVQEVFLVDPFLGSEALKRVVLRQGNESVKLTIVVSPGNIDPDATSTDAAGNAGQHIASLVATAEAAAQPLCGEIEIVHVKRGGGTRQAFHDRYLGLKHRDGSIQAFLLSNSLSKAAGDWPFSVVELNAPTAWRIASYVAGLLAGDDGTDKELTAETVWASGAGPFPLPTASIERDPAAEAISVAYFELCELISRKALSSDESVNAIVDRLVESLPSFTEARPMAELLVAGMHGREALLQPLSHRLSETTGYETVATSIGDLAVERLLASLDPNQEKVWFPPELSVLEFIGDTLAQRPNGTNVLRDDFNTRTDRFARDVEIGRVVEDSIRRLLAGLALTIVGLRVAACRSGTVPLKFRRGIAKDYIHALGRLLSSTVSRQLFERPVDRRLNGMDLALEAMSLVSVLASDKELDVSGPADLIFNDPCVPSELRTPRPASTL